MPAIELLRLGEPPEFGWRPYTEDSDRPIEIDLETGQESEAEGWLTPADAHLYPSPGAEPYSPWRMWAAHGLGFVPAPYAEHLGFERLTVPPSRWFAWLLEVRGQDWRAVARSGEHRYDPTGRRQVRGDVTWFELELEPARRRDLNPPR